MSRTLPRTGSSRRGGRFVSRPGVLAAALVALAAVGQVAHATPEDDRFIARVQVDTKWLDGFGTRQVGTEAHGRLQDELLAKVTELPGVEVWTDEFDLVVPRYDRVTLEVTAGEKIGRHAICAIWPDGVRLNTTTGDGIVGNLVYIGDGSYGRIPPRSIRGQIAVMEMSAYEHYRRAFDMGAAAVVFLESDTPGKSLTTELSIYKPRYYVPAGPLADALRSGKATAGRIVCTGDWQTVTARNIYVGVKPAEATGQTPFAMVAAYDSMSRVYGMAPGADAALDCAVVLNRLRDEAANPTRPIIFGFVDAYHINQMGMRRMAAMLTVTPDGRTRRAHVELEEKELDDYKAAAEELAKVEGMVEGLDSLHDRSNFQYLRRLYKDSVGRDLLRLREMLGELRLAKQRNDDEASDATVRVQTLLALREGAMWLDRNHHDELSPEEHAQLEAARRYAVAELELARTEGDDAPEWTGLDAARQHAKKLVDIGTKPLRSRNRVLEAAFSESIELDEEDLPVARLSWDAMVERVVGQVAEQEQRVAFFEHFDKLRGEIAAYFGANAEGQDRRACSFVIGIDLSDSGVLVGPGKHCSYNRIEPTDREFTRAIKHAVKRGEVWPEGSPVRLAVNVDAIVGRVGTNPANGHRALITSAASSFLLPNVTWITDEAPRRVTDSPLDRFARLDWDRITPQLPATQRFLDWVLVPDQFTPDDDTVSDTSAKWRHAMGKIVDVSAGETVPRVPRRGFITMFETYAGDVDGVRRQEFAFTGHDGGFRMPLMCADVYNSHKALTLGAFRLNDDNQIVEALTTQKSMVAARLATSFNLGTGIGDQLPRALTFECTELNGPSFYDARFLEPLTQGTLLDAIRGGAPKQSYFKIDKTGQMWALVPPGTRWQLTVRAGAAGIRMALINAVQNAREQGLTLRQAFQRGFPVEEPLASVPAEISARDIFTLNDWRLTDFRTAGIESDKIDNIREQTAAAFDSAAAAVAADDGASLLRSATRALASEIRAYRAISETGQDVARGAIFLMLILVPFCVAMERLLFAFPRIGYQITGAVGIFSVMTLLLWSFHPAFQISAQPLVIVMAFTILAMSLAVISVVLQRFRGSMREFQSSLAEGSGAQMGRGGLLGSAVFLGIANMRKRKVRTALTGATLVLVTFALLCFSSASSYVDKKDFQLDDVEAKKPAAMVRRPTFGPINWKAAEGIENLLSNTAGTSVQVRSWLVPGRGDANWRVWMLNPETGEQASVRGVLGLPADEDKLSGIDRVLPNWSQFARGNGAYIAKELAEQMGVEAGDRIVVRGYDLTLCGVFDPIALEDEVSLLDGQRILPYDYSRQEQDWVQRDTQDAIEQETESAAAMQPTGDADELFLPAREALIMPTELLKEIEGELRSIAITCQSQEQAADVAHVLSETIVYPVYYTNAKGGVNVVVSTPLIAVPPRSLAVPLVIAALIIFTTMLNSVSERKKEIYVYSSLGLAPMHIGTLFVAEALTYGLMGSVFGYIAGQATATLLTYFGLMEGITLNYSGTAVIKTMLLVQGVVVLAAIVPAVIAGRVASPSSEMDWKVPDPVDGTITTTLPFTVSPQAAVGLVAFIHEYLEAHRDGVLGRFDVDEVTLLDRHTDDFVAGLEARVWLAPFDMGVRQMVRLTIEPPQDGVCEILARIGHETGTPKLWWRLNKPYLYELRRQLLGWRKVTPERMKEYASRLEPEAPTDSGLASTIGLTPNA